jgi:hypothetical protein
MVPSRPAAPNSFSANAAFGLQTDVDDREILFDRDDGALDDGTFGGIVLDKRVHQKRFKIFLGHSLNCAKLVLHLAPGGWCCWGCRIAGRQQK